MKNLILKICSAFLLFFVVFTNQVFANQLKGVRAWPSPDNTRVVLDLSAEPIYKIHYLTKPNRLVIDLESTKNKANFNNVSHSGALINNVRQSRVNTKGALRIVLDLNYASKAKYFSLPPNKRYGHRLVIDLPHKKEAKVENKKDSNKTVSVVEPVGRDVIVAIDAGHGGDDPGALGKYTYEKKVTLQIAKRLKARIDKQKGMRAFLIRTGDYYVGLGKRSEIAKKGNADFLVSIHADGFTSSRPSGASVWILSNKRASTEEVRRMQRHEMHSELLGGEGKNKTGASSDSSLNNIFFSMSKSNSMNVGSTVGHLVVKELKKVTYMHKKKPVAASLAVLKSPYVPSILVEAGFITNRKEEKLLNKPSFQKRIAEAVFKGIYKHFTTSPPQHSFFAQKKRTIKHTIRSGESLSLVAARYSVSTKDLKSFNKLRSSNLKVGQVLKIPSNYKLVVKEEKKTTPRISLSNEKYQKSKTHVVQSGESLSRIAKKYNTSIATLKKYNNLRSTSLAIGQKIKIPAQGYKPTFIAHKEIVHKVKSGESLSVIAHRYGKTSNDLKKYNRLRSTSLAIGQKIKIPADTGVAQTKPKKITSQPLLHVVQSGESLSVIAHRYGKTSSELKKYNKLRSTSLAIGQRIKIPGTTTLAKVNPPKKITYKKITHKVKRGESLSIIAHYYGKSLSELKQYNKLRSSELAIGQKIKIPSMTKKLAKHKVRSGESLSVIANRYSVKSKTLKAFNNLRSSELAIGQVLTIPVS